jgi:hypothetical protein
MTINDNLNLKVFKLIVEFLEDLIGYMIEEIEKKQ